MIVTAILIVATLIRSHRPSRGRPYERLSAEEARLYMSYEAEYLILDVRSREAYNKGHLDNAVNIEVIQTGHRICRNRKQKVCLLTI